jgi:hypothetical protein
MLKKSTQYWWPLLTMMLFLVIGGCARVPGNQVPDGVAPLVMDRELNSSELLDVSIKVFNPGSLPEDADERQGLSPEIREAEARFFPIHLKYTMQATGYWGAVRVVPDDDNGTDLLVRGYLEYSDGESCAVTIEALDARNLLWFRKTYAETARPSERERTEPEQKDIFQDLFNTIANDLARFRSGLSPAEVAEIRQVAELRYAAAMAPDAFSGYLGQEPSGRVFVLRLPARDDPMLERVRKLRVRDYMLVDAINGYYDGYYMDLWEPYNDWRKFRGEEVSAMRKLEQQALTRQILGVAAIVGAIAIGAASDYDTARQTSTLRDVMVMGGAAAVYSGHQKRKESEINRDAIEELGISFQAEAEPLVIEVEGETVRLTGSAEQQYARWRQLLRTMYARETGLIPDVPPETTKKNHEILH